MLVKATSKYSYLGGYKLSHINMHQPMRSKKHWLFSNDRDVMEASIPMLFT